MTWIALKVLPPQFLKRFEFEVRHELGKMGIAAVVPERMRYIRTRKGSQIARFTPMIPGYVFADIDLDHLSRIKMVHGVRDAVRFGDKIVSITEREVKALLVLSDREDLPGPTKSRFKTGQRVRMKRGAWAELQGLIVRLNSGKAKVAVEMFGKTHQVQVDEAALEAV